MGAVFGIGSGTVELQALALEVEISAIFIELPSAKSTYLYLIAFPLSLPLISKFPNNILSIPALSSSSLVKIVESSLNLLVVL